MFKSLLKEKSPSSWVPTSQRAPLSTWIESRPPDYLITGHCTKGNGHLQLLGLAGCPGLAPELGGAPCRCCWGARGGQAAWTQGGGNQGWPGRGLEAIRIFLDPGPIMHCLVLSVSQSLTHSLTVNMFCTRFVKVVTWICQSCCGDLLNSMIYDLKWSVDLSWLFDAVLGMKLLPGGDFKLVIVGNGRLWPASQDQ